MLRSIDAITVYYLREAPIDHVGEHEHEAVYDDNKPEFDVWKNVRNGAVERLCFEIVDKDKLHYQLQHCLTHANDDDRVVIFDVCDNYRIDIQQEWNIEWKPDSPQWLDFTITSNSILIAIKTDIDCCCTVYIREYRKDQESFQHAFHVDVTEVRVGLRHCIRHQVLILLIALLWDVLLKDGIVAEATRIVKNEKGILHIKATTKACHDVVKNCASANNHGLCKHQVAELW